MSNLVGQTLGKYAIRRELGRGGMAAVYLAYQDDMAREVAVKVLPREFLYDQTFLERFRREARAIASLFHPRILPVYDFGESAGYTYLVMRYLDAGALTDRLGAGPLLRRSLRRVNPVSVWVCCTRLTAAAASSDQSKPSSANSFSKSM